MTTQSSNKPKVHLSDEQIVQVLYNAGFRGDSLVTMFAISIAESGGWADEVSTNTSGRYAGTRDRGLFQLNDYFESEVSDSCAFDPNCAAQAAYSHSKQGTKFSPTWVTFTHGLHKPYLERGRVAAGKITGVDYTQYGSAGPSKNPEAAALHDAYITPEVAKSVFVGLTGREPKPEELAEWTGRKASSLQDFMDRVSKMPESQRFKLGQYFGAMKTTASSPLVDNEVVS